MATVIQVRDVPDEVRDSLAAAAADEGLSLSRYLRRELELIAKRRASVEHNRSVIAEARQHIGADVHREAIVDALREGREERGVAG